MNKPFSHLLTLTVLVTSSALAQTSAVPKLEKIRCPADVKASECAYLSVPEQRAQPSKKIKLFVAIARSSNPKKVSDLLVFLAGGPGEKASGYVALAPIFPERDVVVFDQRGVGRSRPALECPEVNRLSSESGLGASDAATVMIKAALIACGKTLRGKGIALEHYNATESAADVEDLRRALGVRKINLYGGSYGTRLGQEVLRRFSGGLRVVILDSVIPTVLDRPADTPYAIDQALRRVLAACQADTSCNARFPGLERIYTQTLEQLSKKPLEITLAGQKLEVSDTVLQGMVFISLYAPQGIAEVPSIIYAARDRSAGPLETSFAAQFVQAVSTGVTWGAFFSHECRGEVAFSDPKALQAAYLSVPQWRKTLDSVGISSTRIYEVCRQWGLTQRSGHENSPLSSTVPTLLLGGEFDPVTPTRNLRLAAQGLSRAQVLEFAGAAHIAGLSSACGIGLVRSFLSDPEKPLEASCARTAKIAFKLT